MAKPILIKPTNDLSRWIKEQAKAEKRKPGPMVLILLERMKANEQDGQPKEVTP